MPDSPDDEGPFAFLRDRDAFLRRYILSLVLAPPPSKRRFAQRRPAPPQTPPASKKK
jgi:hypothetical protein